jgi:hypothetical protein
VVWAYFCCLPLGTSKINTIKHNELVVIISNVWHVTYFLPIRQLNCRTGFDFRDTARI